MEEQKISRSGSTDADQRDAGQPVQIVNVRKIPSRPSQFILEKTPLRQILKEVGNRNVCVLSITGASRQGKSFLMNIIRHFLEELEKGAESPWKNITQLDSLQGFHIENRNVRDTIGFWMWSKPFIFKQSDGNEIAVLLMDTQGVFDQYSTKREWSMIVGLSLLTSSCVIYNLLNNLLEDNLEIVSSFVEFGMLTLQQDQSATSAFQKLLFLIRDWGFPCDTAYGAVGGSQFIQNKLRPDSEMPEDLQKVRTTLRSVFEEIECFLMPNPGNAAKQNDYNGSLKNLDPVFLKNLEEFLSNLIIIDDLSPLCIAGQKVQGQALVNFFAKYIDLLNKQEMPTAKSIYEATVEANVEVVTQEYVDSVMLEVEAAISEGDFLVVSKLKQVYDNSCTKAMSLFRQKYGCREPGIVIHFTNVLIQELRKLFSLLSVKNLESKKKFVSSLLETAAATFKDQVEMALQGSTHTSPDMDKLLEESKVKTLRSLNLGNRPTDFFEEVLPQLNTVIESQTLDYRQNNAIQLESIESNYRKHFESLLKDYEEKMDCSVPTDDLESITPEKLLKTHQRCEDSIVQKLLQQTTFETERMKEKAVQELKSLTSQRVGKLVGVVNDSRTEATSQALELVQQAVDEYCYKMEKCFTDIKPTEQKLISEHRILKAEASELMSKMPSIMKDYMEIEKIKRILEDKIAESFKQCQAKLEADAQRFRHLWKSAVQTAESKFEEEVRKCIHKMPHPEEATFIQHLKSIQANIVHAVGEAEKFTPDDRKSLRHEVEQKLMGMHQTLFASYSSVIKEAQNQCENDAKKYAQQHSTKLQEHLEDNNDQLTTKGLYEFNKSLTNELKLTFDSEWRRTLPLSVISKVVDKLVINMDAARSKLSDDLNGRIRQLTCKIEEIIKDCCDTYVSEMEEKLDDESDMPKLEKVHKTSQKKAEKEFKKQVKEHSSLPQIDEMTKKFHTEIERHYQQQVQCIDQNQQNLKQYFDRMQQASVDVYRKNFAKERATISTEHEFRVTHDEGLKLALKFLKQSISENSSISFSRYHEQESNLESSLEEELKRQKEEWHSLNRAVDEQTRKSMQDVMTTYQNRMNEALGKWDFLSLTNLQDTHDRLLSDGLKIIRNTKKPQNADPEVYERQLTQDLRNIFNCFLNENLEKRRLAESKVNERILELRANYSAWLTSQKNPQTVWNEERDKCLSAVRQFCLKFNVPGGVVQEFVEKSKTEMIEVLNSAQEEWDKIEPNEAELDLGVIRARRAYEKEMDCHITKVSPLLHSIVLKLHHKKAFQKATEEFQAQVKQTRKAKERLVEALEVAFMRYQDDNDAKGTDAGNIAVGIDLGTTYSCVGVYRKGDLEIIPDMNNHKATVPSYVLFETKDKVVVGDAAKDQSVIHPQTTVFDSKRLIGRRFNDKEVKEDIKLWPFKVINDNKRPKVVVHGESFFPEEISGKILKHLKTNAEQHLGHEVKRAVITVPAYFTDAQKRATKTAADFAGLEVLELLSEPTAAAIAYNFHYNDEEARNVFVYDLGGGTFDVSILASQKGEMNVKAIGGNNHLGGQDFDNAMVKYCVAEFNRMHHVVLENIGDQLDKDSRIRRVRNRCENAKINLSKCEKVRVILDRLYQDKDLDVEITREEFNRMIEPMLQETIKIADAALTQSGLTKRDISEVVLVGGSSRIPRAQELLKELFDRDGLNMTLNPDEVVARGAAYRAAMLSGAKDRKLGDIKFNNVTPFALGTDIIGDRLSIIIPKNTAVPSKMTKIYYTSRDYQTSVRFLIYEGEDPVASRNNLLGNFTLAKIPPALEGKEPIDVMMELDEGGLLNVTAVCRSTGGTKDVMVETIRAGLTKEEVDEQLDRHKEQ